ncbi:hypothetical protein D030_1232A, partial [Vibrio parahaemolyticus AQ3810]
MACLKKYAIFYL